MTQALWNRWGRLAAGASGYGGLASALAAVGAEAGRTIESPTLRWSEIGVEVRRKALSGRLGGLSYRWDRRIALVDASLNGWEAEFVAAHEVGHMVLSHARGVTDATDEEGLCDLFAVSMLQAAGHRVSRPQSAAP